jgi:hypothetical protein
MIPFAKTNCIVRGYQQRLPRYSKQEVPVPIEEIGVSPFND